MNKEELLKPRVKVIAPMLLMKNKVGELLPRMYDGDEYSFAIQTSTSLHYYPLSDFEALKHLFELLPWYAERDVNDLPEYLKFDEEERLSFTEINGEREPDVHKVKFHQRESINPHWMHGHKDCFISEWKNTQYSYGAFLPATLEEYNNYLQSKNK